MRLLLDTHAFLWSATDPDRLSRRARRAIEDGRNEIFFSPVSAWEIGTKTRAGKLRLPAPPDRFIPQQLEAARFAVLPLQLSHALREALLPPHHADPFDRMLVAQALVEELALVSADERIRRYRAKVVW